MRAEDAASAEALLRRFRFFEECIVGAIEIRHFGTVVDIAIDNIWREGHVRRDDAEDWVHLKMNGVQEMVIRNALTEHQLNHLDRLNWGFNEVAQVLAQPADESNLKLVVLWEGQRRIEVSCMELEIYAPTAGPPGGEVRCQR
jgi:hypothetical protein